MAIPNFKAKTSAAQAANMQTYEDYYARLRTLALAMFEWSGLPDSVNARFLEQTLFDMGKAVFVFDPDLGYLALKTTPAGKLNVYNEPVAYKAYGTGYSRDFDADACVLIRNNYDMNPTAWTLNLFAQRLTEVERSIDVNVKAVKTPLMIVCDDRQRLTLKNLYNQYNGNEPVIYGDKSLSMDSIKSINTQAPFLADKLMLYKHDLWNEAMTFLGINNANTDKKERLITNEVDANTQSVMMSAQAMLLTRREAAKQINKVFGLNIEVNMRDYTDTGIEPEEPVPEEPVPEAEQEGQGDE